MILEGLYDFIARNPSILLIGFLLYVFIFGLSLLINRKKPGRNPFWRNHEKPIEKLVTDVRARDAVIKQRFTPAKVPDNLDAIVIGSGMGGMTAAALLSQAGKKVLVLEQHDQAGGCCHTYYSKKGFEFDTGIHYVGDMGERDVSRFLCNQLTDGQVEWIAMDEAYDTVALGEADKARRYRMVRGREEYIRELKKNFPKDHEAIDKYMNLIHVARTGLKGMMMMKIIPKWLSKILAATGIVDLLTNYFKYSRKTVTEVLNELTDNQELKATLSYIWGDYGVIPKEASFSFHAGLVNHYLQGSYYPRGGPSEIAFHIVPVIERSGGRILVQAPVSKILTNEKGRAVGVTVKRTTGDVDIKAKYIISNAGANNTFKYLLPPEVATKSSLYPLIDKIGPSASFITVFLGLDGTDEEMGLTSGNIWYYRDSDIDGAMSKFYNLDVDDVGVEDLPLLYISSPSAKDPSFPHRFPGKSVLLVITLAKYEWFEQWKDERIKHRGDDYNAIKDRIGERIIQQCIGLYPKMENKVSLIKVGTPVTNNYYLGTTKGEMYGLNHNQTRFLPEIALEFRPKTDIPGLYLTGQDVSTCGFVSVMYAGLFCASSILNRNLMNDMMKLRKDVIKEAKKKKVE
ncbi:hypothetical protein SNE40_002594 [Patella caerulea]|uniref:Amine oxidase domain-containing protein n=1 Tax=Patella caerulea TaxID=87958 RepID=A0AAN8K6D9_PATCE